MRIAVVGLGKIGLELALVSARAGHNVIGVEKDKNRILEICPLTPGIGIQEKVWLKDREIVFIVVGTYGPAARFETNKIERILEELKDWPDIETLVCIVSTVNVGDIEKLKKIYANIAYCPVMVAQGTIAKDLENPEYVLLGRDGSGGQLQEFWRTIAPNSPQIVTSTRNVELAKIALNFMLTLKISLANRIGEFCEESKGNIEEIVDAFKYDTRLSGSRMWQPGLGFGGPCFPKDIDNWLYHNPVDSLGLAVKAENNRTFRKSVLLIKQYLPSLGCVTILGLAYKPDTSLTIESRAKKIYDCLKGDGIQVFSYDPSVHSDFSSAKEAIKDADVVFIAVPWKEFKDLKPQDFRKDQVVIDPWRVLLNKKLPCKYIAYGVGEKRSL